jgi:hypothetical protein
MKYIQYGQSFQGFNLGFSITKWSWNIDLGFWWIGGEF